MHSNDHIPASRSRRSENIVYLIMWLIVVALYLLNQLRSRAEDGLPLWDVSVFTGMVRTLIPFLLLFLLNNHILIPRLLLRNRLLPYFLATSGMLIILFIYEYVDFGYNFISPSPAAHPEAGMHPHPHPHIRPFLPLPLFLDIIYALLLVGLNMAVALMFQRFDDKLEHESMKKVSAENQLSYLRAQIHPHFYMNMLNNIHGMIEIDAERAQVMLIDMSKLMRYMLYDSSRRSIHLSAEIEFLRNYVGLMRQRFPESRVKISTIFPSEQQMAGIETPPLLFLVFVENAFKHGISYRQQSYVAIDVKIENNNITFSCENSIAPSDKKDEAHSGIGLVNVRQRLGILFGDRASLNIESLSDKYVVTLTFPIDFRS